ncbi:hypothetical protein [Streptomyces sp. MUM 178J]|nr:hypothetical protein [Streptomyces sp. MUM 178J]WRQ79139.1 hypothetical protein I3F59_006980 [Streptomyces sp. MUM 178J]
MLTHEGGQAPDRTPAAHVAQLEKHFAGRPAEQDRRALEGVLRTVREGAE